MNKTEAKKGKNKIKTEWNLGLIYKSEDDPAIENDIKKSEKLCDDFALKYDVEDKAYLRDEDAMLMALTDFEKMMLETDSGPLSYFYYLKDLNASHKKAGERIALFENRLTKSFNKIAFFEISIGQIKKDMQDRFLQSQKLAHFKVLLKRIFDDAKYCLSVPEEKIMGLKSLPAYDMWVMANEKFLSSRTVVFKGKKLPLSRALNMIQSLEKASLRKELSSLVNKVLKEVSDFSEAEINAVFTNKKINDELRGYSHPYESTVRGYRNDPKVVENLLKIVTEGFSISQRFYKLKAKLLKQKKLKYCDRSAKIGKIKKDFSFDYSINLLKQIFGKVDEELSLILDRYSQNGEIDAFPKLGKAGGAYCSGSFKLPVFILLNHIDDFHSFTTVAHELGHAFHTEFSRSQGILYHGYSMSLAETASTFFESIAISEIFDSLSHKEKVIVLHDKINDDIATIFRQIACFNFELDLHKSIREKGFLGKDEIAELHNKHMKAYLGPIFDIEKDDGYFFSTWSHIRRFFYVYSYAYGQLVSKALLKRYREDKSFWKSIKQFLSSGGKADPEEILREIGIDLSSSDLFREGLEEIKRDIGELEKLVKI